MQRISCCYYKWYKLLSLCYATLEVSIWKALKNILRSFPLWQVKDDTVSPHLHSANRKLDQRGCCSGLQSLTITSLVLHLPESYATQYHGLTYSWNHLLLTTRETIHFNSASWCLPIIWVWVFPFCGNLLQISFLFFSLVFCKVIWDVILRISVHQTISP